MPPLHFVVPLVQEVHRIELSVLLGLWLLLVLLELAEGFVCSGDAVPDVEERAIRSDVVAVMEEMTLRPALERK